MNQTRTLFSPFALVMAMITWCRNVRQLAHLHNSLSQAQYSVVGLQRGDNGQYMAEVNKSSSRRSMWNRLKTDPTVNMALSGGRQFMEGLEADSEELAESTQSALSRIFQHNGVQQGAYSERSSHNGTQTVAFAW